MVGARSVLSMLTQISGSCKPMTQKQRYLLSRLAEGITIHHVKGMCQAWGIDAVFLPLSRGIDRDATMAKIAQHVLDGEETK